jgi:hypothetical protein
MKIENRSSAEFFEGIGSFGFLERSPHLSLQRVFEKLASILCG